MALLWAATGGWVKCVPVAVPILRSIVLLRRFLNNLASITILRLDHQRLFRVLPMEQSCHRRLRQTFKVQSFSQHISYHYASVDPPLVTPA